jgi:hypothetical protein
MEECAPQKVQKSLLGVSLFVAADQPSVDVMKTKPEVTSTGCPILGKQRG